MPDFSVSWVSNCLKKKFQRSIKKKKRKEKFGHLDISISDNHDRLTFYHINPLCTSLKCSQWTGLLGLWLFKGLLRTYLKAAGLISCCRAQLTCSRGFKVHLVTRGHAETHVLRHGSWSGVRPSSLSFWVWWWRSCNGTNTKAVTDISIWGVNLKKVLKVRI